MSIYLQVQAGPHQFLLDVEHVIEVADAPAGSLAERRLWRGRSLPVTDLAAFLGVAGSGRRQQIVLGNVANDAGTEIIDVDRVIRIIDQPASAFADLVAVSGALAELVEGACIDAETGSCVLRLRHPYSWHADNGARST